MKQRGTLALLVVVSLVASATSATARSAKSLQSDRNGLAEAATRPLPVNTLLDVSTGAVEKEVLLTRLSKAETLAVTERQALRAQQQVLIALEQEQEALASKLNSLEATSSSDGLVVEKGIMSGMHSTRLATQPELPPLYEIAAPHAKKVVEAVNNIPEKVVKAGNVIPKKVVEAGHEISGRGTHSHEENSGFLVRFRESEKQLWARYNKAFWEKMVGIAMYLVQIFVVAVLYMQFCKHSTVPKLPESQVRTEEFQFGAFDASDFMRDCQMCLCAMCCPWIRWADTASAPHILFLAFLPGLFITALLAAAGSVTFGLSIPILLLIVVLCRQRIREAYGLPSGSCGILFGDCLLWVCCPCCAIVQEARQVEYVETPMQEYGP